MNEADFDALLASVEEMNQIVRGKKKPSRVTEFDEPHVKEIRDKPGSRRYALLP